MDSTGLANRASPAERDNIFLRLYEYRALIL